MVRTKVVLRLPVDGEGVAPLCCENQLKLALATGKEWVVFHALPATTITTCVLFDVSAYDAIHNAIRDCAQLSA